MNVPAYAIGLPEEWVAEIKKRSEVRYIAESAVVPRLYASEGKSYLESQQTPGRFLQPNIVLWYSYYPDSSFARTALAISNTPTFPDIRRTLPWDDKMQAVVMVQAVDSQRVDRGFYPPLAVESFPAINTRKGKVLKWGNSHCGENKQLFVIGDEPFEGSGSHNILSEPYVEGESHRILVVGTHVSQLHYTSDDWRKNVRGKIQKLETPDGGLVQRTRTLKAVYGLQVLGVDFVTTQNEAVLLEVNTYPSLDEDDGARDHFIEMAAEAVREAQHAEGED